MREFEFRAEWNQPRHTPGQVASRAVVVRYALDGTVEPIRLHEPGFGTLGQNRVEVEGEVSR